MKKNIVLILKDLCCSRCKNDFDENDIKYIHQDKKYNVINISCSKCGKDFGTVFLKLTDKTSEKTDDIILKDNRDTPPINFDDVISAHEYIKNFETNWQKFINE